MALTLVEAAKLHSGDIMKSSIIELYARNSDVLQFLPFENISGNSLSYNREDRLPGVGFRGVNQGYTESTGVLNPQTERLTIAGGDLDVDKFIVDTMGADQRSSQEAMKVRALALRWGKAFIKGDQDSDPREFDGLQKRVQSSMIIDNHSTGAGLSLAALDEAIDAVDNPTAIIMNKALRRRLTQASRDTTIGGHVEFTQDSYGRRMTQYADLPILIVDEDEEAEQILPFNEAGAGGGSSSTSLYVVSMGEGKLIGLQNGDIGVRDMGELESKPAFRTRVEWYSGFAIYHGKSVARVRGITNAPITK
jgi:hypothetical protein